MRPWIKFNFTDPASYPSTSRSPSNRAWLWININGEMDSDIFDLEHSTIDRYRYNLAYVDPVDITPPNLFIDTKPNP